MEKLEVFYEDIEAVEASNDKRLSVVISTDGLSSFIHDRERILHVQRSQNHYSFTAIKQYVQRLVERYQCRHLVVYYDNPYFTLLPLELISEDRLEEQLRISFEGQKEEIKVAEIEGVGVCFRRSQVFYGAWRPKGVTVHEDHFASRILSFCTDEADISLCVVLSKSFYVLLKSNSKLIIATRYTFEHQNDVLYQLKHIDNHVSPITSLTLAGFISEESALFGLLHNYFAAVHFSLDHDAARFDFMLN